jgi:hypothetical protein
MEPDPAIVLNQLVFPQSPIFPFFLRSYSTERFKFHRHHQTSRTHTGPVRNLSPPHRIAGIRPVPNTGLADSL